MLFCTNCGQQLSDDARFCANCGTPIKRNASTNETERKNYFDGEIHKCPHCGEVLKAFEAVCPSCKYELRGAKSSSAVKDLAEKLEYATNEKQRIIIIKNFPVPNTKEDIFEFMLLASTNFDASYYATHLQEEDISDAWLAKIEQCYQKAKLMFDNPSDIEHMQRIHDKIIFDVKNSKYSEEKKRAKKEKKEKAKINRERNKNIILVTALVVVFAIIGILSFVMEGGINTNPDEIKVGVSNSEIEGQYFEDVVDMFEKKGFINIEAREDGWNLFQKSGTVKSVTIDGKENFSSYSKFLKDAKIIIFYYK